MKIIRTNKPEAPPAKIVIRRSQPPPPPMIGKVGTGWPLRPGYPEDADRIGTHLVEINGSSYVFLWHPNFGGRGEPLWDLGVQQLAPSILAGFNYRGVCTAVYRSPRTPPADMRFDRRPRK